MNPLSMEQAGGGAGVAPWMVPPGMRIGDDEAPALKDIPVEELSLRRLYGAEIGRVAQLRGEINLSAAAAADPDFMTREKKETN